MLILNRLDMANILVMEDAITAVEEAFSCYYMGNTETPVRISMEIPDERGHLLYMPSLLRSFRGTKALGIKVYAQFDGNPKRSLPLAHASYLLIDPSSGRPLALMEGMYLTGVRTGASSAVAAKHLVRKDASSLGIIGTGFQAFFQAWGTSKVIPINRVYLYDISMRAMKEFAEKLETGLGLHAEPMSSAESLVTSADVVITATNSNQPVFRGDHLREGTTVIAIGSFHPNSRELDDQTIERAAIYVDSYQGTLIEAGDILLPIERGVLVKDEIKGELAEVVAGVLPGRERDEDIIVFKAVGLGITDTAVAKLVYDKAIENEVGKRIELMGELWFSGIAGGRYLD